MHYVTLPLARCAQIANWDHVLVQGMDGPLFCPKTDRGQLSPEGQHQLGKVEKIVETANYREEYIDSIYTRRFHQRIRPAAIISPPP